MPNRVRDIYALFAALLLLITLVVSPIAEARPSVEDAAESWRFQVFLDDKEIGYHHYHLVHDGEAQQLVSEANFEYRLLFVTLFRYQHENVETWSGDCLERIESRTDSNGKRYRVAGSAGEGAFLLESEDGTTELPGCVMTFAYWNPDFLEQPRLLNSQDGSYVDVRVSEPEREELLVRGEKVAAKRYRVEAGDLSLDLWYSENDEWLALESEVGGGRTLRYRAI